MLRVEAGLFFANADHVRASIEDAAAADRVRAVVLDCETVPFIDVTAARMLTGLDADLGRRGVRLTVAGEIGQVRDMLTAGGGRGAAPGHYRTVAEAVSSAQARPPDVRQQEA